MGAAEAEVERVLVVAPWSTYRGRAGRVTARRPGLMVLIDGERLPVAVRADEVVPELDDSRHVAGAE